MFECSCPSKAGLKLTQTNFAPQTGFAREAHACARIKDPYTNHVNVLIVGGFNAATGQLVRTSELWDPTLGVVRGCS
jgi:hypothetical protein